MKVGVLYSGGKDSNYVVYKALKYGYKVNVLINILPRKDSFLFHYPNAKWVKLQAKAIGIPIIQRKEKTFEDFIKILKLAKKRYKIQGILTGALRSTFQATRFQKACLLAGLWCFNPLWLKNEVSIIKEVAKIFDIIIVGMYAYPLDLSLIGKRLSEVLDKILYLHNKYKINPAGEGGEYETFVIDAPFFKKRIVIDDYEIIKDSDHSVTYIIKKAHLEEK